MRLRYNIILGEGKLTFKGFEKDIANFHKFFS